MEIWTVELGMVAHDYNLRTWKVKAGGSRAQGDLLLLS